MKGPWVIIIFTTLVVALLACTGSMKGIVRQGGNRVKFTYKDPKFGPGEIQTLLYDGERFKGTFVDEASASSQFELDSAVVGENISASSNLEEIEMYESKAEAILHGSRGHQMRCKFRPSDPLIGIPAGGTGICIISDGRMVDVYF
jgi:hypothetical protein